MPPISAACSTKPSTLASAPKPNRLARPAPISPPSSRPFQPPNRDAPAAGCALCAAALLPGWVMDFSIGAAVFGAVLVVGGAWNVFAPRLPTLLPLPTRASARSARSATDATATMVSQQSFASVRVRDRMGTSRLNGKSAPEQLDCHTYRQTSALVQGL